MSLWGGRFTGGTSSMFKQVNDSLPFDHILAEQDISGSIVWSQALHKAGVLTEQEQSHIEHGLEQILSRVKAGEIDFHQRSEEDIHSFVETELIAAIGELGKKLHTGRSRNDQVATDLRLWCRLHLKKIREDLQQLAHALAHSAHTNIDVIMPGYTHLQRAQPVRYAHWCLAYGEMLLRDMSRIDDTLNRVNHCPLGVGALAGTTFPVDRHDIADALGFSQPCANSLDAVSDRDYVLETLFIASTSMMHMSRMAEDLIFFNSGEAGFIQLGDAVTSGSSLMPQKKNPDALELMRGKCGRVFGHLQSLLVTMKGLPLAYNKDMQEDKEGLFDTMNQWHICLCIAKEVIESMTLNKARCREAAQQGYANATELADYLVAKGIPFRTAHDITGKVVLCALEKGCAIESLSLTELQSHSPEIADDVYDILDLDFLVNKRKILGGTGLSAVENALRVFKDAING
ncbi:argininosuccinate lyase [Aestuariibacter sp. AA17]|uniref:Argininosuccinate lyase n=1 Tax=Fluctibacter corallii TaxID=2984329 RepID=A0ABT3A7U3_9ALTE|nr:argininosuccinate lyase [Aestuariibacter sp. AA17]MCV2884386.1 argininosuccinate lyase [Aestuariibacter sp. AA17]